MVNAEVASGGELSLEGQIVGRLQGFRFTPEANMGAEPAKIDNADVASAIAKELEVRANRLSEAVDGALVLANDGAIRWLGDPIAKIASGESLLSPRALILADENLTDAAQQKAQARVDLWLAAYVRRLLGPLFELEAGAGLEGAARNVALQLSQALGVLERGRVAQDVKSLDQNARGMLRKLGVRFGAYYIYVPSLVKPAIRVLATQLWALRQGGSAGGARLDEIPQLAASGRTSFLADSAIAKETYRVAGFRLCGDRAVRVDIVERLADLIRPAVAYRPGANAGAPPAGSADADGFVVTGAMTSLAGCSGEQFASVLRSLGFVSQRVKGPALTLVQSAPEVAHDESGSSDSTEREAPAAEGPEQGGAAAKGDEGQRAESPCPDESQPAGDIAVALATGAEGQAASSEAPAQGAAAALLEGGAVEAAAAPPQEVLIEVWRPRPPSRQRNLRRGAKDNAPAPSGQAPEADKQPGRRHDAVERTRNRRRQHFAGPPQAGVEAESRSKEEARGFRGGRGTRRRPDLSNKAEAAAGRRVGPNKGGAQDERRHEGPSAPAARREPPINLDSPFAKLLALKSQLETKSKGG